MGNALSDKERKVADYIASRPSEAVHPSIEELAASIGGRVPSNATAATAPSPNNHSNCTLARNIPRRC